MGILMEATERNPGTSSYRRRRVEPELFGAMGTPRDFFSETVHTFAINTRETEFGSLVEPIPISLKTYKQLAQGQTNGYQLPPQQMVTTLSTQTEAYKPAANHTPSPVKAESKDGPKITIPPPKKKWIKEYLEEEPKSPVSVRVAAAAVPVPRVNGVLRASPPPVPVAPPAPAVAAAIAPAAEPPAPVASALLLDFVQEHSRPRTNTNSHGPTQIPSPPSVGSNGSSSGSGSGGPPRAGTREVHNKLEKNRRAHLKECFELLKRQLPATSDDKKTSNLSILGSAIRYIQVLRRKERECEHEMERLAREKIAAQQRLSVLKREVPLRPAVRRPVVIEAVSEDKDRDEIVNGQVLGIPISITSSPPPSAARMEASPPRSLNLSTKLRTLPVQISPTTSQVVRASYGARHNTLTLTTLAPADSAAAVQNGQTLDAGALSASLMHPAQIHLPLSPVVGGVNVAGGGLVVGGALQLLGTSGLRVVHASRAAGVTAIENNRITKENGIVSPSSSSTENRGVVVSGLTPLVVSQPHLLHSSLAHKMVETQVVKGGVAPLTVSAQYLSATAIVKPVVVVSSAHAGPAPAPP